MTSSPRYKFENTDYKGRPVRMTVKTFDTHLLYRPTMADYVEQAILTIQDPDHVQMAKHGGLRLCRLGLGVGLYAKAWLVVHVYYDGRDIGTVATYHFMRTLPSNEVILEQRAIYIGGKTSSMSDGAFDTPKPLDMDTVARVNVDVLERLAGGVTFAYDEDGDTLFLTIGEPVPALTEHLLYDVYYQIEPESLRIVGVTIVGFIRHFLANNEFFREALGDDFERLRAAGGATTLYGENAQRLAPLFSLHAAARADA